MNASATELSERYPGLDVVLCRAPPMGFDPQGAETEAEISAIAASGARLCFLALGAPKQEIFAARAHAALPGVGFVSIGAGLDFIAGSQNRAPAWVQAIAAEWLWRLLGSPRRLAARYAGCLASPSGAYGQGVARAAADRVAVMIVAWIALTLWPIVCIFFYRKMTLPAALCMTILGGYLLLPSRVSLDLPLLPELNKATIPTLTAFVLTAIALGRQTQATSVLPGWMPRSPVILGLMAMLLIGVFGTVMTNQDPLFYGPRIITGLRVYDAFSMLLSVLVTLIPLLLARKVLSSPDNQRLLLIFLVGAAVIYCFPALYEIRMSPQLHVNVYGFRPSGFSMSMRGGGFRPNVFLKPWAAFGHFPDACGYCRRRPI